MADVVPVRVAGELVVRISDLPNEALEQIKSALSFPNEEKETRAREKIFGWWDMPDVIPMWRIEARRGGDEVLCLPRGFAASLAAGLSGMGLEVAWDDHRVNVPAADGYFRPFELRDYQLEACIALMRAQQGFYKAPAGSGKTVTALGLMAWANQRSIIVVDRESLVEQWRLRAARFYGFPLDVDEEGNEVASLEGERTVGKIGGDVWEERDLTICLRQTLWSRIWQLDATSWWKKWGLTGFDEGHAAAAETVAEISRRTLSQIFLAFSATPAKSPTRGQIVHALIGPIVHETSKELLYKRKILMRPQVDVMVTDFEAAFWVTHESDMDGVCEVEGCPKMRQGKKHGHRNNYQSVLKKLVESKTRNAAIADYICARRGHVHLVGSRQLKHLDLLKKACIAAGWPEDLIWMLRGEENARGESQAIVQALERAGEGLLFSTVADEALDIPRIDRVHCAFPMRQEAAIIQYAGRGERTCEGKTDAVLIDWADLGCSVFKEQHFERMRVYRMEGYTIHDPRPADEPEPESAVMIG